MCLGKDNLKSVKCCETLISEEVLQNTSINMLPLTQISKPKLSRKLISSVKVNLNRYWDKFGELMTSPSSAKRSVSKTNSRSLKISKNLFPRESEDSKTTTESSSGDQEVSSNINTTVKLERFQLLEDQSREIEDNIANEIKEICNIAIGIDTQICKCF